MSKNICLLFVLISLVVMASSCTKEGIETLSDVPKIELISVSSDTIKEFEETLLINIQYEDGDGDLGFEETDVYALYVRDIRLEEFDGFYVGPIAPPDVEVPIRGELNIEFPSLFVFGNNETETTHFEIKMVDRKYHESNLLITQDIVITK